MSSVLKSNRTLLCLLVLLAALGARLAHPLPLRSLDARFAYSPTEAHAILAALGQSGRAAYRVNELYDLGFLTTYTLLFVTLACRLLNQVPSRIRLAFCLAPGFFDLTETTGVLALIARFPAEPRVLERIVSLCTPLKWTSSACVIAWLLWLGARRGIKARTWLPQSSSQRPHQGRP